MSSEGEAKHAVTAHANEMAGLVQLRIAARSAQKIDVLVHFLNEQINQVGSVGYVGAILKRGTSTLRISWSCARTPATNAVAHTT